MLILQDHVAEEVIHRLEALEADHPEFQGRDEFGRTLAESLALSFYTPKEGNYEGA